MHLDLGERASAGFSLHIFAVGVSVTPSGAGAQRGRKHLGSPDLSHSERKENAKQGHQEFREKGSWSGRAAESWEGGEGDPRIITQMGRRPPIPGGG